MPRARIRESIPAARSTLALALAGIALVGCSARDLAVADAGTADVEWPHYGGSEGGARYSPLEQIDRSNVGQLAVAWTTRTGDVPAEMFEQGGHAGISGGPAGDPRAGDGCGSCHGSDIRFETTPLMRSGTLYVSTPFNRVLALDPGTGSVRWTFDPEIDREQGYSEDFISRGLSAWDDPSARPGSPCAKRLFLATIDARLLAIDADVGRLCGGFGDGGTVRLDEGVGIGGRGADAGDYLVTSPPAVVNDLIVVGSSIGDNRRRDVESGVVRAYDARTGELRWAFDPIPRTPSHPAWDRWTPEGARSTGAANVWSVISADPQRDLVFLPTGSAAPDYYGGERPGRNDFANSIVALRASTGEVVWSFQVVHHDVWDYDLPAQPTLVELRRGGLGIPAVVVTTKLGFVYVLHRENGEPLFPIEERPVPASDVPGESAWPTQPRPVLPAPLHELELSADDAFGVTDADRAFCRDWMARLRYEGAFTPPSFGGTLVWPGFGGGGNWGGAAWDPERQVVITTINRLAMTVQLHPRTEFERLRVSAEPRRQYTAQDGTPYGMSRMPLVTAAGVPCTPPPWGKLVAVDLSSGARLWERPLGTLPQLAQVPSSDGWGSLIFGGPLVTAGGIVVIGGTQDDRIRAFDVETGEELWEHELPAGGQATPMTYRHGGRQYVVIAAGGRSGIGTAGDYVVAFALPAR
jgi:quinoprotein glucose dehydrogenase